MKKRVLAALLCAAMVLALLPITALAADVTSAQALANALGNATASGNTVTLNASVTLSDTVTVTGGTITLDLNGKNIAGAKGSDGNPGGNGKSAITVNGGTLTITGSGSIIGGGGGSTIGGGGGSTIGGGSIIGGGGDGGNGITVAGGSLTVTDSGSIIGGPGGSNSSGIGGSGGDGGNGGNGGNGITATGGALTVTGSIIGGIGGTSSSRMGGSGGTGILIRGGTLTVTDSGSIIGGIGGTSGNSNLIGGVGGDGLIVSNNGLVHTISGGSFTGGAGGNGGKGNGHGGCGVDYSGTSTLSVTGGTFTGGDGSEDLFCGVGLFKNNFNSAITIFGGTFIGGSNGKALGSITSVAQGSVTWVGDSQGSVSQWTGTPALTSYKYIKVVPVLTGLTLSTNAPTVGTLITAAVAPAGATATYQWYRNNAASTTGGAGIPRETNAGYTPQADDVGKYLYCVATGTGNYFGTASAVTSGAVAATYTVTLNQQGGTGGDGSVTATFGSAMPTVTPPTRQSHTFMGYFDATTGGTQYYNADGTSAKAWDKTQNATLYAQWTASPTPPDPIQYQITEGQNGVWTQGDTRGLRFTVNANCDKFRSVWVDRFEIPRHQYTVRSGSTIVTLKAAYLETLSVGRHTLRVNFTDGYAETTFTIKGHGDIPKTGDGAMPALWLCMMLMAGAGLAASLVMRRRRRNG